MFFFVFLFMWSIVKLNNLSQPSFFSHCIFFSRFQSLVYRCFPFFLSTCFGFSLSLPPTHLGITHIPPPRSPLSASRSQRSLLSDIDSLRRLLQLFRLTFPRMPIPPFPHVPSLHLSAASLLLLYISTTPRPSLSIFSWTHLCHPVYVCVYVCVEAHCHASEQVQGPGRGVWIDEAFSDRTGTASV